MMAPPNYTLTARQYRWDGSGCSLVQDGDTLKCVCEHLTDFAIFASHGVNFNVFGHTLFLVAVWPSMLAGLWAGFQFGRLVWASKCKYHLMTNSHLLVAFYCLSR
jgi:hypothetical protein